MRPILPATFLIAGLFPVAATAGEVPGLHLRGRVVDAATGAPLPCRLYIEKGEERFLARSDDPAGSAVHYEKRNGRSVEVHTTLSAHPFRADLPPGRYTFTAERGKEYFPATAEVVVENDPPPAVTLELRRWVDMAARGWYSGDTHVHRSLAELPNVLPAEDLNIAFPLVHWVREAFTAPARPAGEKQQDAGHETIAVDRTHLIVPRNTEYEIFTVGGKRHELGAFFVIGHRTVFGEGVPPVRAVAERARAEGALLELDKHSWPWSMALVPVMNVDLYELANNHLWRAEFAFRRWGEPPPEYMKVETDAGGLTERGWIDYGFQNYYALLNCGFRMRPTAGTASGVHPVPLGFSRVYVRPDGGFSRESWMRALDSGRSFVTTGPMLFVEVIRSAPASKSARVTGSVLSARPLARVEVPRTGAAPASPPPAGAVNAEGARECRFEVELDLPGTSWIAARAFEELPGGRVRFAHSAPVFLEVEGQPLRPRREEVEFLKGRVSREIERSKDLLPPAALEEYRRALAAYEEAQSRAARR